MPSFLLCNLRVYEIYRPCPRNPAGKSLLDRAFLVPHPGREVGKMSGQPVIPTIHFSRILIELGRYIQTINLNRIIDELEAEEILHPPIAQGLRAIDDEYEKSNIVTQIFQGRKEKDFKTFLKIVAAENPAGEFHDATKQFFSNFTMFPGYEEYAAWPNGKSLSCNTVGVYLMPHC